jgi:acyl carrier protein
LLRERFPDRAIDLDVDPSLDLNLDSFAWMELEVALEARTDVRLTEADIAGIGTLRDLLRLCVARRAGGVGIEEAPALARDTQRWLAPTGLLLTAVGLVMYGLNWVVMHYGFQLRVNGLEYLPSSGAYVITPNHVSDLDAMAIAAALPLSRARHVYWAGDIVRLFYSRLAQIFCRAVPRYKCCRADRCRFGFPRVGDHPMETCSGFCPVSASSCCARVRLRFPPGSTAPSRRCRGAAGFRVFIVSVFASGLSSMLNSWPKKGPARPMMSASPMACAPASSHWAGRLEPSWSRPLRAPSIGRQPGIYLLSRDPDCRKVVDFGSLAGATPEQAETERRATNATGRFCSSIPIWRAADRPEPLRRTTSLQMVCPTEHETGSPLPSKL